MARRVYLHVGAPKTGSTYVQHVLWKNWSALRDAGILLPGSSTAHDQAMADLREVYWRDGDARWTWDRLAAKCRKWSGDVIISNEGLGAATGEQAARAVESLQPAEVHVVVAGRDLWRTFPSTWQQSIRARSAWRFGDFLRAVEAGKFDTFWDNYTAPRMLRRWGDLVPAERRHLVTVPPSGAPHDLLWRRFAGVLGIPDGLCELDVPTSNPSLGAAEAEVLRRVNQALGDRYPLRTPYQKVVQRHLVDAVLKRRPNELKFGVGLERAEWVSDLADQQIKELRDYPCQVVGDLAELRPTGMKQTLIPDDLADAQVLDAAIQTIVGMLGHADALGRRADRHPEEVLSRLGARAAGGVRRRLRHAIRRDPA
ncbi:hypothetical protein GA0070616_3855 [Micromonospora nigra]|uniref:Sulfotransferase family protein n=1 Tax=Micromonospora nigra TaxID=145857 RepID=A0A1C6SJ00_9ACTN|nr:hypothetical protein [Micromonospora nigra]SCL29279.1 hypothetical protein GA0070616_3855 [Micromonospora nigra]